jgi:hypothetical protein
VVVITSVLGELMVAYPVIKGFFNLISGILPLPEIIFHIFWDEIPGPFHPPVAFTI